ncbi:hypothetical protein KDA_51230 [Dictyobacter alpinus]|uniref:Uncharacterized protein n=1 Tax=Dictyobacter alpinus TaxID=2014873 RepID=A0A402BE86_9CHLR|nr:hypothetical protein KDA_51230 [Dictyobacter alpinus]
MDTSYPLHACLKDIQANSLAKKDNDYPTNGHPYDHLYFLLDPGIF